MSPELSLCIKHVKHLKCPENLNNRVIKHELKLPFVIFEETRAQTWMFSNTTLNIRDNNVLVHRTESLVTSVYMHFSSLKVCCHNIF